MATTKWTVRGMQVRGLLTLAGALALGSLVACGGGGTPTAARAAPQHAALGEEDTSNPGLFPLDSHPYGKSMEAWAEGFWQWAMSVPVPVNPNFTFAADCGSSQDGPVFYIPSFPPGSRGLVRNCTVPARMAIAVSPSSVLNDYPCPDPTFNPAPGQSLFDFLTAGAKPANGDVAEIDVTLDGQPFQDLLSYHLASDDLMYFTGDLSLQSTVDNCVTGSSQPGVVDSYFILIKPLAPGHHVLTRRIVTTHGRISGPNTVNLDVVADD